MAYFRVVLCVFCRWGTPASTLRWGSSTVHSGDHRKTITSTLKHNLYNNLYKIYQGDIWSLLHIKYFISINIVIVKTIVIIITITRRYGQLRGPTSSSCGELRPLAKAFFALRAKKELIMLFWPIFGSFWCPVVTLVTFSSTLSNFEGNPKKPKKNPKKIQKKFKKLQKIQKKKKLFIYIYIFFLLFFLPEKRKKMLSS